ncbi:MAG TPA: hypothetical protein PLB00_13320, partial [Pseudomonadota bacterium]|nr:hypothetical protein [Pseudomonadota bacterium]
MALLAAPWLATPAMAAGILPLTSAANGRFALERLLETVRVDTFGFEYSRDALACRRTCAQPVEGATKDQAHAIERDAVDSVVDGETPGRVDAATGRRHASHFAIAAARED